MDEDGDEDDDNIDVDERMMMIITMMTMILKKTLTMTLMMIMLELTRGKASVGDRLGGVQESYRAWTKTAVDKLRNTADLAALLTNDDSKIPPGPGP